VVQGMTRFDNRSPRIVVLRRKGRTFADAGGACRAVIGCALAGGAGGIATGRVRTDRLGSGGVSGGASTDHPFGTPGHNPRADDRRGTTDCRLRWVMPLPASGTICHLTCRGPSPHG